MQLVIELDELAKVGKSAAIERADMTMARVQKLIASSPTLTDVVGAAAIENPDRELPLGERARDFLIANADTWLPTNTVREACGLRETSQLLKELHSLYETGLVARRTVGRSYEWKA